MADILVVGAGPVGLTLACELARHGVPCRIIDKLVQPLPFCRAIGVTPRTLEIWDDMGVAREMIDAGLWLVGRRSIIQGQSLDDAHETFPDLPFGHLGLPQYETERVLTDHLSRFGIAVERGVALTTLSQTADFVTAQLARGGGSTEEVTTRYIVGCDGAHSAVRRALGIGFQGDAYPMRFMLGDVHIAWDLPRGMTFRSVSSGEGGIPAIFVAIPLPEPGRYRVTLLAPSALAAAGDTDHGIQSEARGPTLDEIQTQANKLLTDPPLLSDMHWSSIFRISMRLAEHYQDGRVFIAGDAAHIHPPTGGQGMNTGIQDTYNLAWKLALVVRGASPAGLLESYEAERRPVGAEVVARTRAASERFGRNVGGQPDRLADTQIGVTYRGTDWVRDDAGDLDAALPRAGDRAPDVGGLMRHGVSFAFRLFDVLRGVEHVFVAYFPDVDAVSRVADLAATEPEIRSRFGRHVRIVAITTSDDLPDPPHVALFYDRHGAFAATYGGLEASYLVRPDGHIAWRGRSWRDPGLFANLGKVLQPTSPVGTCRPAGV